MKIAASIVAAILAGVLAFYLTTCPCERVPGAWLFGDEPSGPVSDWSFANDRDTARYCYIQIDTWRPHSVTLNCMATPDGELYISCARCEGKNWSTNALTHPEGYIKIGTVVYPVTFSRVTDEATLDAAWQARALKTQATEERPRPDHWWSFHLVSRS